MSVFVKPRFARVIQGIQRRNVMANPALNTNPAFRNPAIVPFGIDFLDEPLRECLQEKGVDCDELERIYYQQCQDDAEFNAPRLPRSSDSKLWGFIYGQRLVSAQYQLNTITKDEKFLVNSLNETIKELTMRMNRFYPNFDYKSQINECKKADEQMENNAYANAYNSALADIISENPTAFVAIFRNNGFIPNNGYETTEADGADKFNDYLPENIENELIANYKFNWDFNSNLNTGFGEYYQRIQKLENTLSPKIDSLSKNLRKNFADFLLESFNNNNVNDVKYVINLVQNATNVIISEDLDSVSNDVLATNSLNLLDEMSNSGVLLCKLFYGNKYANVDAELNGKSKDELISILQNVDNGRLILINKSLQIYEYLKYNSMTRLMLTCLMSEYKEYFAQFLNDNTGDDNSDNFADVNNDAFDKIISYQNIYYQNQEDLFNSFNSLCKSIENVCQNKGVVNNLDLTQFNAPPCYISAILDACVDAAKKNENILDEIKYATLKKYISSNASNISGISLIKGLMTPNKNGISGDTLSAMAYQFATNSSDANEILVSQIVNYMQENALNVNKNAVSTDIQSELDNFRNISNQYNESRENLENSIKEVTVDFNTINFEYAKTNYDPLSMYLATFRYYNNR